MLEAGAYRRRIRKPDTGRQRRAALTGSMSRHAPHPNHGPAGSSGPLPWASLVVAAAILGTLVHQSSSSSADSFGDRPSRRRRGAPIARPTGVAAEADGAMPDGVTVFDEQHPGVVNLDPDLLHALRERRRMPLTTASSSSSTAAGAPRSTRISSSVRRSPTYGSEEEAARWVATADTSAHVSGDAVDIGSSDATAWLSEHGAQYGLCPIYDNEPWHFELRPEAIDQGCPADVCRPHGGSEDAAVTGRDRIDPHGITSRPPHRTHAVRRRARRPPPPPSRDPLRPPPTRRTADRRRALPPGGVPSGRTPGAADCCRRR